MGIDKSLNDDYASFIVNGTRYHYGRELKHGQYLIENAHYAKDYWCFDRKDDLLAFLVNLPESADRDRHRKLYPDWQEVTHEQRVAYMEEDLARLRRLMEEKQAAGAARKFHVYPDDGPLRADARKPLRIIDGGGVTPLARIKKMLRNQKQFHAFERDLNDAGKLAVLERLDWSGVSDKDKEAILKREVDFKKITPEGFAFVYEDIAFDREEPADATVARKLFEKAHEGASTPGRSSSQKDRTAEEERGRDRDRER